jgi:hypothetical protein
LVSSDEKLPVKAANSLPEFFQEEFPTFQKFIDIYYQYQKQAREGYQAIGSIKDIDEVGAKYLEAFYKTFASNMPVFPYMGMADFVRNARAFYVSRGSEDSFRFLFRIMFGAEIEFKYPKENMFRPSSGKWAQKVTVYVRILTGTISDALIGKKLLVKDLTGSTVALVVKSYIQKAGAVYEIEVDNFIAQAVVPGARVFALINPVTLEYTLQGEITSTLSAYQVTTPGEDFRLGSVHEYTSPAGVLSFRVTALDNNKGIKRIEFLSFPGEYTSGPVTHTFDGASIQFIANSINRYSGYYENTDGFLSNNSRLQDSYFYQIFSYVIKSRVSRELYEDITTKILHPAGLIMFSEYEKLGTHTIGVDSSSDIDRSLDIIDPVIIYDTFNRVIDVDRTLTDTVTITEAFVITVGKIMTDTVTLTDSGVIDFWAAGEYTVPGYTVDEFYTTADYQTRTI